MALTPPRLWVIGRFPAGNTRRLFLRITPMGRMGRADHDV